MTKKPAYDISGLTEPQKEIFLCDKRFRVVCAGRRFGKTVLGITECLYEAQKGMCREIWYTAPTYRQAKDLVWEELKRAIPKHMIASKNESELSIILKGYKSKIVLKGSDNPDSLRGKGLNFVVFDEVADQPSQVWYQILYPALTDKSGSALFIGTPKGYNWFYDLYEYAKVSENWQAFMYTTAQGGNVTEEELNYARKTLSSRHFKQEFEASFETLSNRVYFSFDIENNVDPGVEYVGGDIYVGMDFNVDPMSAVVGCKVVDQLHVFDEVEIPNGNTEEMCEELKSRYGDKRLIIAPDPSGRARKTSAPIGQTDYTILEKYGHSIIAPKKAPPVADRINEVNALCMTADGARRLYVHPRCRSLIRSFMGMTYKEGTSIPDRTSGLDHMMDACGYLVHSEFPILRKGFNKISLQGY